MTLFHGLWWPPSPPLPCLAHPRTTSGLEWCVHNYTSHPHPPCLIIHLPIKWTICCERGAITNNIFPGVKFFKNVLRAYCDCIAWGGREEDKKINSDKSSFDVLDLILITSIFAANWSLLSWDSKFTKSRAARFSSLFVGVIMKLSNFGSSLSDCQILGAPCQQWGCQWGWRERVTWFQATFALWEPNTPFESRPIFALLNLRLFLS